MGRVVLTVPCGVHYLNRINKIKVTSGSTGRSNTYDGLPIYRKHALLFLETPSFEQVFFCGMMDKASELVGEGAAEPTDFSLLVGASMWAVRVLQVV